MAPLAWRPISPVSRTIWGPAAERAWWVGCVSAHGGPRGSPHALQRARHTACGTVAWRPESAPPQRAPQRGAPLLLRRHAGSRARAPSCCRRHPVPRARAAAAAAAPSCPPRPSPGAPPWGSCTSRRWSGTRRGACRTARRAQAHRARAPQGPGAARPRSRRAPRRGPRRACIGAASPSPSDAPPGARRPGRRGRGPASRASARVSPDQRGQSGVPGRVCVQWLADAGFGFVPTPKKSQTRPVR
jgi:hypothetical protein